MSNSSFYQIWNEVEKLPPRLRQDKLNELCGDNEEMKTNVLNTINICTDPDISANIWSHTVKKFIEGDFKREQLIGQKIGYYTLISYIAEGGMAHVYYAER
ncbi:MAG: hypothetical protein HRT38_03880, partial [Alteromonadaceae bacterium]|nr:hypothetical protein [Alteromonadaceae bacterium]